jgi:ABC-2 type transport system ATP-binding protein
MSEPAISIRGLQKSFRHFTLGPLDLTVPTGAIYGLIGPNGVGKTTTIELMLGMGRNDAGTIRILGLDHVRDEAGLKQRIGYVSPDLNYQPWRTVSHVLRFHRGFYPDWDDEYCRNLLESLQVGGNEKTANLSFGARIKLGLIVALSHRPTLLLLDEPTVGLDVISKQQIFAELLAAVEDEERTVLIASHALGDVERFADHVGIMVNGKLLVEGATNDLVSRYRVVDFLARDAFTPAGIAGLFVQECAANRWRVLMDIEGPALEQVKVRGATEIGASPVTLEDLFIGLVKGRSNVAASA